MAHFFALRKLVPPPPDAPAPLAGEQHIDRMARDAGFVVDSDVRIDCPWHRPDLDRALRGLMTAGPVARCDYRQPDGSYLFRNKFRALTGQAH